MRLREIAFSEFLSFKEPVRIADLSPGTNVIVGRNGSGKSNVLAAIRFIFPHEGRCSHQEKLSYFYEGNQLAQQTAFVEICFDNTAGRFPGGEVLTIRRTIDSKKDELTLDGKAVTREELCGLFESAGFSRSNLFFIVPQGEVERLSLLDDAQRYDLIKEVSGAAVYERDRLCFMEQLSETAQVEKKIGVLKEKIDEKIEALREEQRMQLEAEAIDEEKGCIERVLLERELGRLDSEIRSCQLPKGCGDGGGGDEPTLESCQDALKSIRSQVRMLLEEKSELQKAAAQGKAGAQHGQEEWERAARELERLGGAEHGEEDALKRLGEEAQSVQSELIALEHERVFLESNLRRGEPFSPRDAEECEAELRARAEELERKGGAGSVSEPFCESKFRACISERKALWVEEKEVEGRIKKTAEALRQAENNIISMQGSSYQALLSIKGEPGVHGCVYELISIPEELFTSVSTVMGRHFFSVIVDNDVVATSIIKKISKRLTFIPLNRVKGAEEKVIEDDNMIPIWEQIGTDERYQRLLKFLCRDTYLVSDIRYATAMAKKHGVSVVTLEGEYIAKSGVISGGHEKRINLFTEFKKMQKRMTSLSAEKAGVAEKIRRASRQIDAMNAARSASAAGDKALEKRSLVVFLRRKLGFLKKGRVSEACLKKLQSEKERLEIKRARIELEINSRAGNLHDLRRRIDAMRARADAIKSDIRAHRAAEEIRQIDEKVARLRREEEDVVGRISREDAAPGSTEDLCFRKKLVHRNLLLEKRASLLQRLEALETPRGHPEKYRDAAQDVLIAQLKRLCLERKGLKTVNSKASLQLKELEMQHNSLLTRMGELAETRRGIEDFVEELDRKKESAINLAFNMVCDSFSHFFSRLCPGTEAQLVRQDESVCIWLNGENLPAARVLSGGQKAVLALSLIFAVQRIDPSSFYVFDEIDANLDQQARIRLCDLIREISSDTSPSQFILTTFKSEMLGCGKKFFGVSFRDKRSHVTEISREEAERRGRAISPAARQPMAEEERCPICLSEYTSSGEHRVASLKCGHLFGSQCIQLWFNNKKSALCPKCYKPCKRSEIRMIFATNVVVIDVSKEESLVHDLFEERKCRSLLERENKRLSTMVQYLSSELTRCEERLSEASSSRLPHTVHRRFYRMVRAKANEGSILVYDQMNGILIYTAREAKLGIQKVNINHMESMQFVPLADPGDASAIRDVKTSPYHDGLLCIAHGDTVEVLNVYNNNKITKFLSDSEVWSVCFDPENRDVVYGGDRKGRLNVFSMGAASGLVRCVHVAECPIHSLHKVGDVLYCAGVLGVWALDCRSWAVKKVETMVHSVCTNLYGDAGEMVAVQRDSYLRTKHVVYGKRQLCIETNHVQFRRRRDKVCGDFLLSMDDRHNRITVYDINTRRVSYSYRPQSRIIDFHFTEEWLCILTCGGFYIFTS
ncbi:UNVERIFIED_CONTAM: hypothetical protein PYX00_010821 [Menopon gallinae]|uniref:RING-type domain-containing protein n=1 Tax=Menopon gallinae TaxID=328185 RepID=A0AAW2H6Y5_9NEOP